MKKKIDPKEVNGIFLELKRWFEKLDKKGVLQIGNFSGQFFHKFQETGFKNINYIDNDNFSKLTDKANLFEQLIKSQPYFNIANYDTIFLNVDGDEYAAVSKGIPQCIKTVIIRYGNKPKVKLVTLKDFMATLKFGPKFEAEHKKSDLVDLIFVRVE